MCLSAHVLLFCLISRRPSPVIVMPTSMQGLTFAFPHPVTHTSKPRRLGRTLDDYRIISTPLNGSEPVPSVSSSACRASIALHAFKYFA